MNDCQSQVHVAVTLSYIWLHVLRNIHGHQQQVWPVHTSSPPSMSFESPAGELSRSGPDITLLLYMCANCNTTVASWFHTNLSNTYCTTHHTQPIEFSRNCSANSIQAHTQHMQCHFGVCNYNRLCITCHGVYALQIDRASGGMQPYR